MGYRAFVSMAGFAAIAIISLNAQTPRAAKVAPRLPDGTPDIQGIWSEATLTPLERPKGLGTKEFYSDAEFAELSARVRKGEVGKEADLGNTAEQAVRYGLDLYGFDLTKTTFAPNKRTSLIVGPEGVVAAMLPEARKRNAERAAKAKGHEFDSYAERPLQERCILLPQERIPMLPGPDDNLLQIVQGPGYVALLHEIDHSTRVIPTDGRPHVPQNMRQYQGDSVGHWEGNTLVVDTTNFTNLTNFRGSSEKLHLVERFTRSSDDVLTYQFTVEDPTTWDRPWTAEAPMTKSSGPVYEWACHEGNTMISTILRGARLAEEEAAQKAAAAK